VWLFKDELRQLRELDDVQRTFAAFVAVEKALEAQQAQQAQQIQQAQQAQQIKQAQQALEAERARLRSRLPPWAVDRLDGGEELSSITVGPLGTQEPEVTAVLRLYDDLFELVLSYI
jgi:hypothetical protein